MLAKILHLPPSVQIMHVSRDTRDFSAGTTSFYVVDSTDTERSLPDVPEGEAAPWIDIEIEQTDELVRAWKFKRFA